MKREIKKLTDKFFLAVTVIAAVAAIFCGKAAARERGEMILQGTPYKSVMLESSESAITVRVDGEKHSFDKGIIDEILSYRQKLVRFSPFGSVAYLISCVEELVQEVKCRDFLW